MNSYVQEVYSMLMEGHKEWAESEMESDKPAEVFDAHPISAMKVSDGDSPGGDDEQLIITDTWKPEWQRGVQVPVNPPTDFPQTVVKTSSRTIKLQGDRKRQRFSLPTELLRCSKDNTAENSDDCEEPITKYHRVHLEEMFAGVCRYDVDLLDHAWISVVNEERKCFRQRLVEESMVEHVVEALEILTHDKLQEAQRQAKDTGKGGLEYDETVICDVCKEPDGEDGNEMVFCDGCDVCIHQACYGILKIPEGNWLCRPCSLGFKAVCALCPKPGGALKPARDGARWCHVSCALWIPEVGFGDVEKMEPITKITDIPAARWSLVCCLCKERVGACIQCAVKTCKTAFHVTCAHQHGLSMQQILTGDDVRMLAYCQRHSSSTSNAGKVIKGEAANTSASFSGADASDIGNTGKPFAELEASFHTLVSLEDLRSHLSSHSHNIPADICQLIHDYWKLKRRASGNQPLLKVGERPPVIDEEHARLVARMQMFITLRHDLERARNLCYMILRREKMKRSRFRSHELLVKLVCRHVKKNVKTLSDGEMKELRSMPFFPDDIYDSGPTFAARSLVYAKACPEQELMTRQELNRLQDQTSKSKRRNSEQMPSPGSKGVKSEKSVKAESKVTTGKMGRKSVLEKSMAASDQSFDTMIESTSEANRSQVDNSNLNESMFSEESFSVPESRLIQKVTVSKLGLEGGSLDFKSGRRRRGRASLQESVLRASQNKNDIETSKGLRGRPPLDDSRDESLIEGESPSTGGKSRRGRPPLLESVAHSEFIADDDVNDFVSPSVKTDQPKRRGRPPAKRKRSDSFAEKTSDSLMDEFDSTTEWVSVDDLIGIVTPIDRIPRDQLLVSDEIKDRLRGGLMRRKYRGLIRSVGAASTSSGSSGPFVRDTNVSSSTKNIFDRMLSTQA